jgi:dynein heavy chain
MQAQEV